MPEHPIDNIRIDGDTEQRESIDQNTVDEYAEAITAGATFPPVVLFYDSAEYWLAEGFHRYHAYRKAGKGTIPADVRNGTLAEAQWFSFSANQAHGLRRSNEDKARAVKGALLHPNGEKLSNGQIAAHVGVSDMTVAKYRAELTPKVLESSTPRTGRDGRTINTSKIGRKPAERSSMADLEDWAAGTSRTEPAAAAPANIKQLEAAATATMTSPAEQEQVDNAITWLRAVRLDCERLYRRWNENNRQRVDDAAGELVAALKELAEPVEAAGKVKYTHA